MAVPKRRHSKSRTKKKRNSHYKLESVNFLTCKECGELRLPHRICKNCKK